MAGSLTHRKAADLHKGGTPLVCLTAYTTPVAKLVDRHFDIVLVGDSAGMVLHGLPCGLERALMVVDMPAGSYEEGPEQAFRNAARLMAKTGCGAVKLEGGESMAAMIHSLPASASRSWHTSAWRRRR